VNRFIRLALYNRNAAGGADKIGFATPDIETRETGRKFDEITQPPWSDMETPERRPRGIALGTVQTVDLRRGVHGHPRTL
jgi:hypothetical protein